MLTSHINDFDLHYDVAGGGEPVVLVHGSFSDLRYWTYQVEPIARAFRTLTPSMRPYWPNGTVTREGEFDVLDYVRDIGTFIEMLDLGPVHLCGHSLGGHVCLRVAGQYPSLVHSLVLAEPGGPLASETAAPGAAPAAPTAIPDIMGNAAAMVREGDVEGAFDYMFAINGAAAWSTLPDFYKEMARANAATLLAQAVEQRPPITAADIAAVTQPVLLIGGATSPQPFPRILDALEAKLADARRVSIPGGTHLMNIDNPTAFNDAVVAFWRTVPMGPQ